MRKPLKAALLSALLYPGAGHYFVKKYPLALAIIFGFSVLLYRVVSDMLIRAQAVIDQINLGTIAIDVNAIKQALLENSARGDINGLNIEVMLMLALWFIAIVDAYRVAKRLNDD